MSQLLKFTPILFLLFSVAILGQSKKAGPIITDFGMVHKIDATEFKVDTTKTYKAVFDIMNSPVEHDRINATIETAARFLNMHAQSGVPTEQLKFALVVHNKASKDIITNEAYNERYGTNNPNYGLIKALLAAGGEIIFCGQSAEARDFPKEELIKGVKLSLSAMTALIHLQDENYRLIKF